MNSPLLQSSFIEGMTMTWTNEETRMMVKQHTRLTIAADLLSEVLNSQLLCEQREVLGMEDDSLDAIASQLRLRIRIVSKSITDN